MEAVVARRTDAIVDHATTRPRSPISATSSTSIAPSRQTNLLRTRGTDALIAAAQAAGVARSVAQSSVSAAEGW
jgi:hypothetical protein